MRTTNSGLLRMLSAIGQNQPAIIEIKGVKTSHFKESKTAPRNREEIGSVEHVECPQSEPANNDLQPGRSRMVAATNCERAGDQSRDGGRFLRLAKPTISTTGVEKSAAAKPAISITGTRQGRTSQNQPFWLPALELGRRSYCEPLAEAIAAKVEVGLSARRIYQDLVEQNGFNDSYQSVQRLFASLRQPNHSGSGAWKLDLVRKCRWTSGWEPRFTMGPAVTSPNTKAK